MAQAKLDNSGMNALPDERPHAAHEDPDPAGKAASRQIAGVFEY